MKKMRLNYLLFEILNYRNWIY